MSAPARVRLQQSTFSPISLISLCVSPRTRIDAGAQGFVMWEMVVVRLSLALLVVGLAAPVGLSSRSQPAKDIDVVIEEWTVPNDSFPHDPAVAPDGSILVHGTAVEYARPSQSDDRERH